MVLMCWSLLCSSLDPVVVLDLFGSERTSLRHCINFI
jgi:hypothetical protein